jgi:hypothetical protein
MKVDFIILTLTQNKRTCDGITLHLQRRRKPKPYLWMTKIIVQFSGMMRVHTVCFLTKEEIFSAICYIQMFCNCDVHCMIEVWWKKRIVYHNNAYPHTSHLTLIKTEKFGWEVLLNTPYIQDFWLLCLQNPEWYHEGPALPKQRGSQASHVIMYAKFITVLT